MHDPSLSHNRLRGLCFLGTFGPTRRHPLHAIATNLPTGSPQQQGDTPIAVAVVFRGESDDCASQHILVSSGNGRIALRAARLFNNPAGVAFGDPEFRADSLDSLPAPFGAYKFPEATSLALLLERKIGNQTLQTNILPLKVLHPSGLIDFEPAVFLPPAIIALLRYPGLSTCNCRRLPLRRQHLNLAQQSHGLFRAEPLLQHLKAPLSGQFSHIAWFKEVRSGQFLETANLIPNSSIASR